MEPGTHTPLSVEDARILALEAGPIRGHTLKVLVLGDAPEAAELALRESVAARLPGAPRWRWRLVEDRASPTGLAWEEAPIDLARHVRTASEELLDDEGLRGVLAELMRAPLDRARPLWTLEVLPRLTGGRWAIVWKVHHCLADGMTLIREGARLLWTAAPATEGARPHPRPTPKSPFRGPGWRVAALAHHRGLVVREFRRVRALSPLAAEIGPERAVALARCTLDELRRIGKAIAPEVTINDVLLAVVAGALRRWLEIEGVPRTRLKAQVPVSLHAAGDQAGNRDAFLNLELPLDEPHPVARVRAVSRAMRRRKERQDARAIDVLRGSLRHAPSRLRGALQRLVQGPHEYSLSISNVPGPPGPIAVLGRSVEEMYSLAEVAPAHALRVSAVSLAGSLFIGLCADPHAVPNLDAIGDGIRRAIDELRAHVAR